LSIRSALVFSAAIMGVAGCSSPRLIGGPSLTVVAQNELPPPTSRDLIGEPRLYLIGPFDRIAIDVFGIPELSRTVQVDANGSISLPLVGSITAAGKTPLQLSEAVSEALRREHVRDPRVSINLTETLSQVVTVDGSVTQPGLFPIVGRMTLMRAIARAQGVTEFARENHVVVFRRVDNRNMAALYDLRAIRQGLYPDPEIYANDIVLVGESHARRVFRDFLQASGFLAAPLVTLLQ
jgi:polysaccharide biosynthesis/export protein